MCALIITACLDYLVPSSYPATTGSSIRPQCLYRGVLCALIVTACLDYLAPSTYPASVLFPTCMPQNVFQSGPIDPHSRSPQFVFCFTSGGPRGYSLHISVQSASGAGHACSTHTYVFWMSLINGSLTESYMSIVFICVCRFWPSKITSSQS